MHILFNPNRKTMILIFIRLLSLFKKLICFSKNTQITFKLKKEPKKDQILVIQRILIRL